jgi:type I restriction enzyme, S subunit
MTEDTTLGQLAKEGRLVLNDGYRTRTDELGSPGVAILRVAQVQNGRVVSLDTSDRISESFRRRFTNKTSCREDIVVTTKGTVGRVARIREGDPEYVYSPQLCFFRCTDSAIDRAYLYYWFCSPQFREQASFVKAQTDMADYINLDDLRRMHIRLPDLQLQRAIGCVLGTLDNKIESNKRLVDTADWVLRHAVLLEERQGWPEVAVSDLATFINGGAYTRGSTGRGRMVIRIAELSRGPGASTVYNELDLPDEKLARPGDLLMSWSGSLGVYRWVRDEAIVNQHIFKVVCSQYPAWLVFDRLRLVMPTFARIAADKATTMGHIKRHHLDDQLVGVPPTAEDVARLDRQLGPVWARLIAAERESLLLENLRDALLPELLSGRLRVPKAERLVESVT